MKTKNILLILFLCCTSICFAQNKLFDKYSEIDNVTSVYISKAMFQMMPKICLLYTSSPSFRRRPRHLSAAPTVRKVLPVTFDPPGGPCWLIHLSVYRSYSYNFSNCSLITFRARESSTRTFTAFRPVICSISSIEQSSIPLRRSTCRWFSGKRLISCRICCSLSFVSSSFSGEESVASVNTCLLYTS